VAEKVWAGFICPQCKVPHYTTAETLKAHPHADDCYCGTCDPRF